jgi:UDP-glucuronate decarboxylase
MQTPDSFTGPVNLGNPGEFTIKQLALRILELTGSKSDLIFEPLPADDPKQRRPDITLAKSVLNWQPNVQLDAGLRSTITYFSDLLGLPAACVTPMPNKVAIQPNEVAIQPDQAAQGF